MSTKFLAVVLLCHYCFDFYSCAFYCSIAKSQHYDVHGLVDIFRLYGDYLYKERGDHDGAIEQYIKTIGKLEPSYVIRRVSY